MGVEELQSKGIIKLRFDILSAIEYLFVIILILDGNSVYHSMTNANLHFPIILAILSLVLGCLPKRREVQSTDGRALLVCIMLFLVNFLYAILMWGQIARESYICMFLIGVPFLYLYFNKRQDTNDMYSLFYKIDNIITLIALLSTIIWVLGPTLNIIKPNCSITINWGYTATYPGYFGMLFELTKDKTFGLDMIQNNAFFTEAPMLNLWLDIAIGTELFLKEKYSINRLIILLVCIVTTISTTAIIFVIICFILRYIRKNVEGSSKRKIILLAALVVLVPIAVNIINDVLAFKSETGSYRTRMAHFVAGYLMWKDNPIFGAGYGNLNNFLLLGYTSYTAAGGQGFSNSITAILGSGGLWNAVPYFYGIIAPFFHKSSYKIRNICFIVCYAYLSISTIFFARFLQAVFVAFGLSFIAISRSISKEVNNT